MSLGHLVRLHPDPFVEPGRALAATLYDAAWLLARQWQLGELGAEDAGTPVAVHHEALVGRLEQVTVDAGATWQAYDPHTTPLGAVVEAVPAPDSAELGRQTGQELVRALKRAGVTTAGIGRLADQHRLVAGPHDGPDVVLAAGAVPDGRAAWAALVDEDGSGSGAATTAVGPAPAASVTDPGLRAAVTEWIVTCGPALARRAGTGWDPRTLTHQFSTRAPGGTGGTGGTGTVAGLSLTAERHQGGPIAWWGVDARAAGSSGQPGPSGTSAPVAHDAIPTRAAFPGMPAPRWWQLEEHRVDLAAVSPANADLAKTAMLQFGLLYGNDHFLLPISLERGTVCSTTLVRVTDAFGGTTAIPPSAGAGWGLFTVTGAPGGTFVVMPGDQPDVTRTVGTLHLVRDEMANLVWAIDGDAPAPDAQELTPPTVGAPTYRLRRRPPPAWHPMVVDRADPTTLVPSPALTGTPGLLGELAGGVHRNAIPAEGRRVVLEAVLSRWTDGSTHLRYRHRSTVHRAPAPPGLAFDEIEHP